MAIKKIKKIGLTLVELMIANVLALLAIASLFYASITIQKNMNITSEILGISEEGRLAINHISRDAREARLVLSSHSPYATGDTTLILRVPSIDQYGDLINPDTYFDIIIYALDTGDPQKLLRIVDAHTASSREDTAELIAEKIDTLLFSSNGTGLSSVTDKGTVRTVTIEIITMSTQPIAPGRQNTIISSVSLRNKK